MCRMTPHWTPRIRHEKYPARMHYLGPLVPNVHPCRSTIIRCQDIAHFTIFPWTPMWKTYNCQCNCKCINNTLKPYRGSNFHPFHATTSRFQDARWPKIGNAPNNLRLILLCTYYQQYPVYNTHALEMHRMTSDWPSIITVTMYCMYTMKPRSILRPVVSRYKVVENRKCALNAWKWTLAVKSTWILAPGSDLVF